MSFMSIPPTGKKTHYPDKHIPPQAPQGTNLGTTLLKEVSLEIQKFQDTYTSQDCKDKHAEMKKQIASWQKKVQKELKKDGISHDDKVRLENVIKVLSDVQDLLSTHPQKALEYLKEVSNFF